MSSSNNDGNETSSNDNGNTMSHSLWNSNDSNDSLLALGTMYGEVTNRFLSAKNSIEIHKNKVISNNQSLPNVTISDRGHSLNTLINHHFDSKRIPADLQSVFIPVSQPRPKRAFEDKDKFIGQKPPKTVNFAPLITAVVPIPASPKEDIKMTSRQSSATKILITHRTSNLGLSGKTDHTNTDPNIIMSDTSSLSVTNEDGLGVEVFLQHKKKKESCDINSPHSGNEMMEIDVSKSLSLGFESKVTGKVNQEENLYHKEQEVEKKLVNQSNEHNTDTTEVVQNRGENVEMGPIIEQIMETEKLSTSVPEQEVKGTEPGLTFQFQSPTSKDMGKISSQAQSQSSLFVNTVSHPKMITKQQQAMEVTPVQEHPLHRRNNVFYHNNVTIQRESERSDVGQNTYNSETRQSFELSNRFSNTDLSYYQHAETHGTNTNTNDSHINNHLGGSAYNTRGNTDGCPSPLHQTSVSDYTLMNQTGDDNNYKSSCLFLPPAENYVYNAQINLTNTQEIFNHANLPPTHPLLVNHRDQEVESDISTPPKVDNHNYDADEDIGDPGDQPSVLTMINPRDLPVPDFEYVSRLVPVELHGLISRKCKKDCRVWLWKSKSRRQEFLDKQQQELKFSERDRDNKRNLTGDATNKKQQQHASS